MKWRNDLWIALETLERALENARAVTLSTRERARCIRGWISGDRDRALRAEQRRHLGRQGSSSLTDLCASGDESSDIGTAVRRGATAGMTADCGEARAKERQWAARATRDSQPGGRCAVMWHGDTARIREPCNAAADKNNLTVMYFG